MLFLKIVHIYLTVGSLAACYFGFIRRDLTVLPLIVSIVVTLYLGMLFFIRNRTLLFNSMLGLLILQLISIKTAAFGFLFSLGFGLYIQFSFGNSGPPQYLATLSAIDFSPLQAGGYQMAGVNLLAFIMTSFTLLTKERKNHFYV